MNIPYIYLGNYKVDDELIQYLVPKDYGRFYTSFATDDPPDKIVNGFYAKIVEKIMREMGLYEVTRYEYDYWLQAYNGPITGHAAHQHCRIFADEKEGLVQPRGIYDLLSWCHFIRSKNQPFEFVDSTGEHTQIPPEQNDGDLIVFPVWAWHRVQAHGIPDFERITIAGNITLTQVAAIPPYGRNIAGNTSSPNTQVNAFK